MQGGDFVHRLLDVVLAKGGLAGGMGLAHRLGAKGFGHRQQPHRLERSARGLAGAVDARVHGLQVLGNGTHVPKGTKVGSRCWYIACFL